MFEQVVSAVRQTIVHFVSAGVLEWGGGGRAAESDNTKGQEVQV